MKIDISEENLKQLINSDIPSNRIAKATGVTASTIQRIRLGERKIENLTIKTGKKLQQYWEELNMQKPLVKWTGKSTDGISKWSAEGLGYKDLFDTLIQKYGNDIVTYDMLDVKQLEVNGEDLEKYDVTVEGISNLELFKTFDERSDLKQLSEQDYKEVIADSKGNAYYQTFEEEMTLYYKEDGKVKEEITGFHVDIVQYVIDILNELVDEREINYDDLIFDIEQSDDTERVISLLNEKFNNKTHIFTTEK